MSIGGTNGFGIVGTMRWINAGVTGVFAAAPSWTITNITLALGTNIIAVSGQDGAYEPAADTIMIEVVPEPGCVLLVAGLVGVVRRVSRGGRVNPI